MCLLKPLAVIQRDHWVSGWFLGTKECYWVFVTDGIRMELHSLSSSCPFGPHWTETLKQLHAKVSQLCISRKNCLAFAMGGALWDSGRRWRESRKPTESLTAGKVSHPLSLLWSIQMTQNFFFLNDTKCFLNHKLICLKSFFFFFVIRSFTYNNQSLEATQISITSWFDKLLFVFRLSVLCHSVVSDSLRPHGL